MRHNLDNADISNPQIVALVNQWIQNSRNAAILIDRLTKGMTYDALSTEYGLSVRQIKTIVYRGIDKISKHL